MLILPYAFYQLSLCLLSCHVFCVYSLQLQKAVTITNLPGMRCVLAKRQLYPFNPDGERWFHIGCRGRGELPVYVGPRCCKWRPLTPYTCVFCGLNVYSA